MTPEEFNRLPKLCAYTEFNGHSYGVTEEVVDNCDLYVIDPAGVEYLKTCYTGSKGIVVFGLVENDETVLRERMRRRGDSEQQIEARLRNDTEAFQNLGKIADFQIHPTTINNTVLAIHEKIVKVEAES